MTRVKVPTRLLLWLVVLLAGCGHFGASVLAQHVDSVRISYFYSFIHDSPQQIWLPFGQTLTIHDDGGCDLATCEASADGQVRAFYLDCGSSGTGTVGPWVSSACSTVEELGYTVDCCILGPTLSLSVTGSHVVVEEPGVVITYTYEVANAGGTALTDVLLHDDLLGSVGLSDAAGNGVGVLEPGDVEHGTRTYAVSQADFDGLTSIRNVATATSAETDPVTSEWTVALAKSGSSFTLLPITDLQITGHNYVAVSGRHVFMASRIIAACETAVFVFDRHRGWAQTQVIPPAYGVQSIDVSDSVAVIGGVCGGRVGRSGAAIYRRHEDGSWQREQTLISSVTDDHYGIHVALSGEVAVVSHLWADPAGAYVVFRYDGGVWVEEQVLTPARNTFDSSGGSWRNSAVDISEDVLVIGSTNEIDHRDARVEVHRFDGTEWHLEQVLDKAGSHSLFGYNVDVDGDVMCVADPNETDVFVQAGVVWVYRHNGFEWVEEGRLTRSPRSRNGGWFGSEGCVVAGDRIVVGTGTRLNDVYGGNLPYEAHVFDFIDGTWRHQDQFNCGEECTNVALSPDGSFVAMGRAPGAALYFPAVTVSSERPGQLPRTLGLENHPNPFQSRTNVTFSLPLSGKVQIHVYDVLGREVEQLIDQVLPAGDHDIVWDARGLPSGVYFYRLTTLGGTRSSTATLLR